MTRKIWAIVAGLAIAAVGQTRAPTGPSASPDFKVLVAAFALGAKPVSTEEIIARDGRIYQFRSESVEVVVVDPPRKLVELVDLGRKVQTEVTFDQLDGALAKLSERLRKVIADREATGKRADAIEAAMTRDLIDPRFRRAELPRAGRLRLANDSVEVDAAGEPEADPARLDLIALALDSVAKLGAFRTPDDLPPFGELEAIGALKGSKLRPLELSYLYRLAGPPRKFRRTYKLVPTLTDREREAIARVDRVRETAPLVRYERYRTGK